MSTIELPTVIVGGTRMLDTIDATVPFLSRADAESHSREVLKRHNLDGPHRPRGAREPRRHQGQ